MLYKPEKLRIDQSEKFARKHPHHHESMFRRPDLTRRSLFQMAGAGLAGSFLAGSLAKEAKAAEIARAGVTTQNTAKNVIFILLQGAISGVDTFDFKNFPGVTPSNFGGTTINGTAWPTG